MNTLTEFDEDLERIRDVYRNKILANFRDMKYGDLPADVSFDIGKKLNDEFDMSIKQAVDKYVIGENEQLSSDDPNEYIPADARDNLRIRQRQSLWGNK